MLQDTAFPKGPRNSSRLLSGLLVPMHAINLLATVNAGLVEALLDTVSQATGGANFVDEIKETR